MHWPVPWEYPHEQITRDCRNLTTFEGTNEVLRLYIPCRTVISVANQLRRKRLTRDRGGARQEPSTSMPQSRCRAAVFTKGIPWSWQGHATSYQYGKSIANQQHALRGSPILGILTSLGAVLSRRDAGRHPG